ncbi:MAG: ankyrin repeat domain-containing protein [Cyanobacteria bacterium J06642_2]
MLFVLIYPKSVIGPLKEVEGYVDKDAGFKILEAVAILVAILGFGPRLLGWMFSWLAAKAATTATEHLNLPLAFQAATAGNIPLLAESIASGFAIDSADAYGRTLLHCATMAKNLDVLDWLLREGARTDITVTSVGEESTALGIATGMKWHEGAELLLRYGAQMEPGAAILLGDPTFVRTYLDDGGDPDHLFSGKPLIFIAAYHRDTGLVRLLLDAGADVNAYYSHLGWTPLHLAAQGQMELAELLLHRGADIEKPDKYRLRPLHVAASHGEAEIVRLLLDNGADIEANSNAGTPLHAAAGKGHAEAISTLLDRGAICDRRDGLGKTALHLAIDREHFEAVRVLLQRGANVRLKAFFFLPVSQLARDETMKSLLKSYGAK